MAVKLDEHHGGGRQSDRFPLPHGELERKWKICSSEKGVDRSKPLRMSEDNKRGSPGGCVGWGSAQVGQEGNSVAGTSAGGPKEAGDGD